MQPQPTNVLLFCIVLCSNMRYLLNGVATMGGLGGKQALTQIVSDFKNLNPLRINNHGLSHHHSVQSVHSKKEQPF